MNAKEFLKTEGRERCKIVSLAAKTNFDNFLQIALYNGGCSYKLAKRLAEASGGVMSATAILDQRENNAEV
tara:strand:- start:956 stop:1168 length:213 start_codon:yes stop_codon:yes gene_type:complete